MNLHDTHISSSFLVIAINVIIVLLLIRLVKLFFLFPSLALIIMHIGTGSFNDVDVALFSYTDLLTNTDHGRAFGEGLEREKVESAIRQTVPVVYLAKQA